MTAARTGPTLAPVMQTASLPIFRAGTHVAVDGRKLTFTPEVIRELAESYDPSAHEAPLVVGHPRLDAPAYGWAKSLSVEGDVLRAVPHQVEPAFAELVNAGRFKKVSASIYLPDSPGNPCPGKHYVKHIGFLGAAAPAVKGLPSVQFAEGDGAVEFADSLMASTLVDLFQRLRDWFVEREGAEAADRIIPQWAIKGIDAADLEIPAVATAYAEPPEEPETLMTDKTSKPDAAAFAEREARLTAQAAELASREAALAAREAQAQRDLQVEFADQLVAAGKILPRERDAVVEVLLALPADAAVAFAEGDGQVSKPAIEVLRQLLSDRPQVLDTREKSAPDSAPKAAAFAAPDNLPVDSVRADLHARAVAYQHDHPEASYLDAVRIVSG